MQTPPQTPPHASPQLVNFAEYVYKLEVENNHLGSISKFMKEKIDQQTSMNDRLKQENETLKSLMEGLIVDNLQLVDANQRLEAEVTNHEMEMDHLRCNGMVDMVSAAVNGSDLAHFKEDDLLRFQHLSRCIWDMCQSQRMFNMEQHKAMVHEYELRRKEEEMMAQTQALRMKDDEMKALQARLEEKDKKCAVCMEVAPDTVLQPCNHMCICYGCYGQMIKSNPLVKNGAGVQCPLCRSQVKKVCKVFVS